MSKAYGKYLREANDFTGLQVCDSPYTRPALHNPEDYEIIKCYGTKRLKLRLWIKVKQ